MKAFRYISAQSCNEAQQAVGSASGNGKFLAGGIDLLAEMKDYIVTPELLVDVKRVKDFDKTAIGDESVTISGLAHVAEIAADSDLAKLFPGMIQAAGEIGSPQIRNVATLGGNLLQHSRCWYYRQRDLTCLRRGGDSCPAAEGDNRYLAIFTGCACISTVVSNMSVILTALDAKVNVIPAVGGAKKTLSMEALYANAWTDPKVPHSLDNGDLVTGVSVPTLRKRSVYLQQSEKRSFDWALVSCGVAGNVSNGTFSNVRVVLGASAPVPYQVPAVNAFLEGKPVNEESVSAAAKMMVEAAKPLAENGYKVPLAQTLIRRALLAMGATT